MRGLEVARVRLFFSFMFREEVYPCALVHWFGRIGDEPDEDTGMWMVQPELDITGRPLLSVIHLDCIFRAAHLIGICGQASIPRNLLFHDSLDAFKSFYANKFADHHAFAIAF
jgi:hypothetical protein